MTFSNSPCKRQSSIQSLLQLIEKLLFISVGFGSGP